MFSSREFSNCTASKDREHEIRFRPLFLAFVAAQLVAELFRRDKALPSGSSFLAMKLGYVVRRFEVFASHSL